MDTQPQSVPERIESSITNVTDSRGETVPHNTTTEDTVLTLSGRGTVSSIVFIFDSSVLLTTASVTAPDGTWRFTETVELGLHVFTVRDTLGGVDSPEWVVTVGEAELELREPAVAQAPGGILNPMDAINGATVVVTYAMRTTDTIGISWNGQDNLVATQPGSTFGSVTFTIPASAVAPVIGKAIEVLYGVVRNGASKPSAALPLMVQTLPDSALEAPKILQAPDNQSLDVDALSGDAGLTVRPWPFIAEGQHISLRFESTKVDDTTYNWVHPIWQDLPITSTGEPSTTVALSNLKGLKNGSSLKLIFEVSFDSGLTKLSFPIRTLNVKQAALGFEGFERATPGLVPRDPSYIDFPSGLRLSTVRHSRTEPSIVRAASPHGEHGFQYLFIPMADGGTLLLPGTPTSVKLTTWAARFVSDGLDLHMYLHGRGGVRFATRIVPVGRDADVLVEIEAPPGNYISSIQFGNEVLTGELALDSIYWSA